MGNPLHLFEGYGIEIEYMIGDRETLSVRSIADELLKAAAGQIAPDFNDGRLDWSNELVLHVIELKGHGPAATLRGLHKEFHRSVRNVNKYLANMSAVLIPSSMHPWMHPDTEMRLWPHDNSEIYSAYNRIFDCRGHGWSNLQSMHINLPFANDEEFGRLHAAVRLVLPLLPALAASSPFVEGQPTGLADNRLQFYKDNQKRVPMIAGDIIPERAFTREAYDQKILRPIFEAIAPHDTDGILQDDWLNSRGAIARWERQTIEIRLLDTQECPKADLAIATLVVELLKKLVSGSWLPFDEQAKWESGPLRAILDDTIIDAENARINNLEYARIFAPRLETPPPAGILWRAIRERLEREGMELDTDYNECLSTILDHGTLATRIHRAVTKLSKTSEPPRRTASPQAGMPNQGESDMTLAIRTVYRELTKCLEVNQSFQGM